MSAERLRSNGGTVTFKYDAFGHRIYKSSSSGNSAYMYLIHIRMTGARDADFDPERWWEKRISVKRFAHEMAGMVVAMWELSGNHATRAQLLVQPSSPLPQHVV